MSAIGADDLDMEERPTLTNDEKLLIEMGVKFQCAECGDLVNLAMTSFYHCPRCGNRVCSKCIRKHKAEESAIVCPVCGQVFRHAATVAKSE